MAIDLAAIRAKVQQLQSGNRGGGGSNSQLWKPELPQKAGDVKEYKVRVVPWADPKPGEPFKELWFYYFGDNSALTLKQFGEFDPIDDLRGKLFKDGEKELAKRLFPKMRAFAAIVDRADEDKGVQIFSLGKMVNERMLGFFLNEEIGDYTDPDNGLDLIVKFKKIQGKKFCDTEVDVARKSTKLSADPAKVADWLKNQPNPLDVYKNKKKGAADLEKMLNDWLNSGGPNADSSDGSSRGSDEGGGDSVASVAAEIKASEPVKEEKTGAKKKGKEKESAKEPEMKTNLDDAFNDLMADE
jgi:hypothetical protein